MEQFVQLIVAGGLSLLTGLWLLTLPPHSPPWFAGLALVILGTAGLTRGLLSELDRFS